MKIEADKRQDEREANIKEDFTARCQVIAQVHNQKDNASREMENKKADNKAVRDMVKTDLTEGLKRRRDEEAHELAKRQELIR